MSWPRVWVAICGLLWVLSARAESNEAEQRSAIQQQRVAAEAQYAARKAECAQAFAVVACEEKARTEHRTLMRRLREQELVLNDAQRQRRAQATQARLAAKSQPKPEGVGAPPVQRKLPTKKNAPGAEKKPAKLTPSRSTADQQASRDRFEVRKREAEAHKEQVELRNAARAASGPKAKPLPPPPGASAR